QPGRALELLAPVADALDDAHAAMLIHRDIKPANILIASGQREQVLLTDFGLARRMDSSSRLTQTGLIVGTLTYLAPEQLRGEPVDGRTDQYALACVLFECLTGSPPFTGELEAHVMYAHLSREAPAPSSVRPDLPPGLDAPLQRALSKEPDERFPTCTDLVLAVRAGISTPPAVTPGPQAALSPPPMPGIHEPTELAPAPTPVPPAEPPQPAAVPAVAAVIPPEPEPATVVSPRRPPAPPSGRRPPWVAIAIAAAVLVAGGVAAVVFLGGKGPPQPPAHSPSGPSSSGPSSAPPPSGGLGIAWTAVPLPAGSGLQELRHVTSDASTVVAVGNTSDGSGTDRQAVVSSTNGGPRALAPLPGTPAGELASVFTRGPNVTPRFVAVGTAPGAGGHDAVAWSSDDGRAWRPSNDGLASKADEKAVDIYGGVTGVVAIGSSSDVPVVWHSDDASTWRPPQMLPSGQKASASAVLHVRPDTPHIVDGLYVVGASDGHLAVWYTKDEASWSLLPLPTGEDFNGHANALALVPDGTSSEIVVVGERDGKAAVWLSSDGRNWTASAPLPGRSSEQSLNSVVALDQGLIAVGTDGPNAAVWSSSDRGSTWAEAPELPKDSSETRQTMLSVTCFGGQLVAVGSSVSDAGQAAFGWVGAAPEGLTQQAVGDLPTFCPRSS
ncbi:MAG TPA: protein kinase, partial [Actinomycetota bacterium]|nr:protein kinase [Actinomycetota bacterium]